MEKLGKKGEQIFGTVDGMRVLEIMAKDLSAFVRFALTGSHEWLLQNETKEYSTPRCILSDVGDLSSRP